ncbi:hypothetical protein SAMN02745136_00420 [Anaerocolumna jejuensis DSM 15929]|uniref:Uncharacterized protein n=1 Tax=Anaerocolumna jejuensis DSM 15929 TaxID=1121322 RepID=A0A1M6KE71_9FIRM|nr:hypothetical protein [Anaerocolumna jejuensis]SHJ57219.1 hypothetical protein SAMN02745136_00420 [Anaerocolumna jejuensis DSM 15929]
MVSNAVEGKGIYFNPTCLDFIKIVEVVSIAVQEQISRGYVLLDNYEILRCIGEKLQANGIKLPEDIYQQIAMEKSIVNLIVLPTMLKAGEDDSVVLLHKYGEVIFAGNKDYVTENVMGNEKFFAIDEVRHNLLKGRVSNKHKRELLGLLNQMGMLGSADICSNYNESNKIVISHSYRCNIIFNIETREMYVKTEVLVEDYQGRKTTLLKMLNEQLHLPTRHTLSLEKDNKGRYKDFIYCTSTYDYCEDGCVTKEEILSMVEEHEEIEKKVRIFRDRINNEK